ncbi:ATP-binding domain-containing protein [Parasphingorhabdus sp. DH2-15]|uniref:ATP-binding domain-containing protein n=1 Tax=Parasphingorhabdus sp. DH2-15 TaxID=3444112 RepID=UPI003F685FBD
MMNENEQREHLAEVAKQSLDVFEKIARNARKLLSSKGGASLNALANANSFTMGTEAKTLGKIDQNQHLAYGLLAREPSIARVVAEDEEGNRETYFISRAAAPAPFSEDIRFASYRSPAGRLASLPPGDSLDLRRPAGDVSLEVVECAHFHPKQLRGAWDSAYTVLRAETFGPDFGDSLRRLLDEESEPGEIEDALEAPLKEEEAERSIVEKRRKSLLSKMGFRDQPILDQFQDKIFRMPIDSRAILLGPPGSGKTTTLIKRLGQKLDLNVIRESEPEEYSLIERMSEGREAHESSWLMLTPTELLRTYVKEAFGRENIAAPNERIRTWEALRWDLARNAFQILRTGDGGGPFTLRENQASLSPDAISKTEDWFADFDQWQHMRFWSDFEGAAKQLSEDADAAIASVGARLRRSVESGSKETIHQGLFRLITLIESVHEQLSDSRERSEKILRGALNLQINSDKSFLKDLGQFIEGLAEQPGEGTDDEESEIEEEEAARTQTPTVRVARSYLSVLRSQALAFADGRKPRGRTAKILSWLDDRSLQDEDVAPLGRELVLQRALRRFSNPVQQYLRGISRRYRSFRQTRRDEKKWYSDEKVGPHVTGLEIDLMLLSSLRVTKAIVGDSRAVTQSYSNALAALDRPAARLQNQVLVDEATDFSPVQLACMSALAHPAADSFFACGDFNQRITSWGVKDANQLKWVYSDLQVEKIAIAYRQTRQLLEFARGISEALGEEPVLAELPDHIDNEGVSPALAKGLTNNSELVRWLADRILEIEKSVHPNALPTIAILVNRKELGKPIAEALSLELEARSLRAVDCTDGKTISETNEVGVFDVNDIKGLEFEAVFFTSIDRLAEEEELYARFLYVGATRAATYLGITCEKELPSLLSELNSKFVDHWA